ncbi:unnamed protein product [Leptidea sinapis]|uniref:Selenoprotein T n=1 Tax=Leptidea sinapis TaxID=189913 RepID=A0A5E4QGL8_9NEOP|nr:unnamed protein product [Leptidea sinapis]
MSSYIHAMGFEGFDGHYSCGYRKVFDDYAGIIQQKYPEISVIGANYDPPGLNMYMSRLIGFGKMIVIMCILSGVNIFAWLNKPQPGWWSWCLENKLYACMMMFFLANMIEGQLLPLKKTSKSGVNVSRLLVFGFDRTLFAYESFVTLIEWSDIADFGR